MIRVIIYRSEGGVNFFCLASSVGGRVSFLTGRFELAAFSVKKKHVSSNYMYTKTV